MLRIVLLEQFKWTGRREHGALIALIVCNVETVSMSVLKVFAYEKGYTMPDTQKNTEIYVRPVKKQQFPQAKEDCVYCGLCAKKCPKQAINVDRTQKLWQLDKNACVGCTLCMKTCPKHCIEMIEE